jgi:hypothetical protein
MNHKQAKWCFLATIVCGAVDVNAESCTYSDAMAPVVLYTEAMKEYRFDDAYAVLTGNMTDGLAVAEWAAGQRRMFELGQVVIRKADVRWPQHIDPASCAERALVPNVLHAKDRFNNQGSVEFELYEVVHADDRWKINSQETLIEERDVHLRFPGDEIPTFKGQLLPGDVLPGDEEL